MKWRKVVLAATALIAISAGGFLGWSYYQQRVTEAAVAAFEKEVDYPLPEKPSIAVLAFENLSGDPEQEYFADGLSENIITGLSMDYNLFVVARNSSFTYKGKAVDVRKVGRELGVRYVLEGSVQKTGARLRITAQLLDAATGGHLWVERYDRELKDLFAVQDEITRRITGELLGQLGEGEGIGKLAQSGTENVEAMTLLFRARKHLRRFNKTDTLQARKLAKEAIALDANFSAAYSMVAWSHVFPLMLGFSETPREDFAKAEQLAEQARQLDSASSNPINVFGYLSMLKGEQDEAIALFKKAISLNPNYTSSYAYLSDSQRYNGQPGKAIESMKTAMRLSPFYPDWYLSSLAVSYRHAGQYEKAISAVTAFRKRKGKQNAALYTLPLIYVAMGRVDDARAEVKKALKINPKFSLKVIKSFIKLYRDPKTLERILAQARLAGIPE